MKHLCKTPATAIMTRAALLTSSFFLLPFSFAKTFDWPIDAPTAGARQFTAYHGETVRFNLRLGGAMTNLTPAAIYYQTNGMGKAEWFGPVPGTVFHPTNDCGAAAYRFFILCNDPDGKDYTANGSLRLLDSPGFVPNELPLPAKVIDFAQVTVLNPPWSAEIASATNIAEAAAANYTDAAVSNASMNARGKTDLVIYEPVYTYSDWTWTPANDDLMQPWYDGEHWQVGSNLAMSYVFVEPYVTDPDATSMTGEVRFGNESDGTYTWSRTRTQTGVRPTDDRLATTNNIPRPDLSDYPTKAELASGAFVVGYAQYASDASTASWASEANRAYDADAAITALTANALAYGAGGRLSADDIASMVGAAASSATNYTDAAIAACVQTNALAGQTFDFATMAGMYRAVKALSDALGGTVTNFPNFQNN